MNALQGGMNPDEPRPGRSPHLLYVAWAYPPSRGSGVYRAWATANAFARHGWRVTVLTAPRETFTMSRGADPTLEERIDPSIKIVRVPYDAPTYSNDIRSWSYWRAQAPGIWSAVTNLRGKFAFPELPYGGWRPALERAAKRVHAEDPVDLTIGTANPNVDFLPGYLLFKQSDVPYVMDYRDAWQLDVYSGERLTEKGSPQDKWERRIIEHAHSIWFVNERIREWHAEQYPEAAGRFEVVENGYDLATVIPPRTEPLPKPSVVFGYVGTITGLVPLKEVLDGWERARELSPLVRASRLDLYGHLHRAATLHPEMGSVDERFERSAVTYHGPVAKAEVPSTYAEFDALVLLAGAGRYVTGGKPYEYASTGLPIASIHDPANDTSRVLADYPGWRGATSMSADDIAATFISVAEYAAAQTEEQRAAARLWAQRYERAAQLEPAVRRLTAELGLQASGSERAA